MNGKPIDVEIRAQIVAALLSGARVSETARKFNIPQSTVSTIKAALASEIDEVRLETRGKIDDLIAQSLEFNIKAQVAILRKFTDEKYLNKTSASSLSEAYERFANHAIRLLEAASAGDHDGEDGDSRDAGGVRVGDRGVPAAFVAGKLSVSDSGETPI